LKGSECMNGIKIRKASMANYEDCKEALLLSKLGETYYSDYEKLRIVLSEGIVNGEIYVAEKDGETLGFIRYSLNGMFMMFPYLRNIAIKPGYRGQGIGTILLKYFENKAFKYSDTLFLLVSDFNPAAKRLYERIGYQQVGEIPNLIKEGISEQLLMKKRG
jgi:ribosomal protein S18 acetylase RimI-like enzyme